jgi:hypothetical protein
MCRGISLASEEKSGGATVTERARPDRPITAEAVGTLVAFLDSGGVDRRRYPIVNRLRALQESEQFATLPEDLRNRVREIVADAADR